MEVTQYIYVMGCRTMFRPGDPIYELCAECASMVCN